MTRLGLFVTQLATYYHEPDPNLTDRQWRAVAALMRRNIETCFQRSRDPERDRTVLRRYLIEDARQTQIAHDLGMSRSRVFQVKMKGLRMLCHRTRTNRVRLLLRRMDPTCAIPAIVPVRECDW